VSKPIRRSGRVVRADGSPVAGALVAVTAGTAPTPEIAIRTDAEGCFSVALPDGRFTLEAHHPEMGRASTTVETTAAPEEIRLEVGGD
jgi:hypothetical protein